MHAFALDLLGSFRRLRRARGFAFFAAGVLALGVGAATALFALVRGVVLRPLPYPDSGRLVVLVEDSTRDSTRDWPTSVGRLEAYGAANRSLVGGVGGSRAGDGVLVTNGEAERVYGARVTGNSFAILGISATNGRLLTPADADPGAPPVVVISDGLWHRRFGGDPSLVGRAVELDGVARVVVGIAPADLAWPKPSADFWIPFVPSAAERNRGWYAVRVIARLAPGSTIESARAELTAIAAGLDREFPDTDLGNRPRLVPMLDDVLGSTGPALRLLQGAVLLVLLVSAANFANLLLARGAAREGELALRSALGGSRRALARLQFAEALALGLIGAGLGIGLGAAALRAVLGAAGDALPRSGGVRLDGASVVASLVTALAAAAIGALLPALAAGARPAAEALRGGGKGTSLGRRRRLLAILVVVEVAAASALAAGSGLLVRSLARLAATEVGVDARDVVTLEIGQSPGSPATPEAAAAYDRRLLDRLAEVPGIEGVSALSRLPVVGAPASTSFQIEGSPTPPGKDLSADMRWVEPGALPLLGVPLVTGRDVARDDRGDSPRVVLVNRAFVRTHFADGIAVGRRLWISNERGAWRTIVGVVGDVHLAGLEKPVEPAIWAPFAQCTFPSALRTVAIVARSPLPPAEALTRLRAGIASFDALQAPTRARTLREALAASLAPRRFQAGLFLGFALLAGALAAAGVYGLTAYSVAQRRDELGVRLALGAHGGRLARLVLGEGLRLGACGLVAGLGGALAATRWISRWLYGVQSWDPLVLGAVAAAIFGAVVAASLLPALRAARTSPAVALRGN